MFFHGCSPLFVDKTIIKESTYLLISSTYG
jgi:hypothetical protein